MPLCAARRHGPSNPIQSNPLFLSTTKLSVAKLAGCICTCVSAAIECDDKESAFTCLDTSAECYEEPGPTPSPVAEEEDADTAAENSAPLSSVPSGTTAATAAGAFVVTALCGGFATAVGW